MINKVLILDISGMPAAWSTIEEAANVIANDKVAWSLGINITVLRGGIDRHGERSVMEIPSIIAMARSDLMTRFTHQPLKLPDRRNDMLYRRDRYTCAYCGSEYGGADLTRDHIVPRSKGGANDWTNCVTSCYECNQDKKDLRVEDFRPLLYLPYRPCRFEAFLLAGRNVLGDQHEYLAGRLPKSSRLLAA